MIEVIELVFLLLLNVLKGLAQMFVTAMWQTEDPAVIAKRNVCLTIYGIGTAIFVVGLGGLWLHLLGYLVFFLALGTTLILFVVAGQLADGIEKEMLQQQSSARNSEGASTP